MFVELFIWEDFPRGYDGNPWSEFVADIKLIEGTVYGLDDASTGVGLYDALHFKTFPPDKEPTVMCLLQSCANMVFCYRCEQLLVYVAQHQDNGGAPSEITQQGKVWEVSAAFDWHMPQGWCDCAQRDWHGILEVYPRSGEIQYSYKVSDIDTQHITRDCTKTWFYPRGYRRWWDTAQWLWWQ